MKWIGLSLIMITFQTLSAIEVSPKRQIELKGLIGNVCSACHGKDLNGGQCPPLTPKALVNKPDNMLIQTILQGRNNTAMSSWKDLITETEAKWILFILRNPKNS
jgi:cytochrome c55X